MFKWIKKLIRYYRIKKNGERDRENAEMYLR